ncbi:MAG: HIT domain-containing protein, partial [Dehalococcoidia bacterium]
MSGLPLEGCFLCEKPRQGEDKDAENLILHSGRHGFIILNLYPYNSGHVMVAPYVHGGDLTALAPVVSADMWEMTRRAVAALAAAYRPDGFNIGLNLGAAAGAGQADHLHI